MSEAPPPGYALVDLGKGYSARFGPVFLDRSGQRVAFRVGEQHLNPVDTCHGGALAPFSDPMIVAVRPGSESGAPAQVGTAAVGGRVGQKVTITSCSVTHK